MDAIPRYNQPYVSERIPTPDAQTQCGPQPVWPRTASFFIRRSHSDAAKASTHKEENAICENGIGMFAICAEKEGCFEYWIAGLYQGGEVPEGMKLYSFPEGDWAMFSAKGPLPGSLQSLNTSVWQEWYPNEGQQYMGTGKAALEGFCDVPGTSIVVFYPEGGVSKIQERQMMTQRGKNVAVAAVRGNFDDAQTGVKRIFSTVKPTEAAELSSANSINIGRLAPQIIYYWYAWATLCRRGEISPAEPVNFSVPTGNFGDILAGYFAKCMGLPVGKLLCASNANNVLTEFLTTGRYDRRRPFHKTISPSMDILVSSNLERLLYLASGGDADMVAEKMHQLEQRGWYQIDDDLLQKIQETFLCGCCDDPLTCETIRNVWARDHYLLDPHTAVAWAVAGQHGATLAGQTVVLSTASPYKFAPAVLAALGKAVPDDAFAAMDELQALTGLAAHAPLAELKSLPILHRDCIEINEMADYVRRNMED